MSTKGDYGVQSLPISNIKKVTNEQVNQMLGNLFEPLPTGKGCDLDIDKEKEVVFFERKVKPVPDEDTVTFKVKKQI